MIDYYITTGDDNDSSNRRRAAGGRRRVNIVGGSASDDEAELRLKNKFCPKDGRELVWIDEVPSWFCPKCGYSPHGAPLPSSFGTTSAIAEETSSATENNNNNNNNNNNMSAAANSETKKEPSQSLSQKVGLDETTTSTGTTDNLFIMPVSKKSRSNWRKNYDDIEDPDKKLFERRDWTFIEGEVHIPTGGGGGDMSTISSEDLKEAEDRRRRPRW